MTPTQQTSPPAPGMKLGDILYVLFRHKWMIAIISLVGIVAAAGVYLFYPLPYKSQATLFVKYVVDTRAPSPIGSDTRVKLPDERGETVILTELAILQSLDLAREAAAGLSADTLKRLAGSTNLMEAAGAIRQGLMPDVPKKSSVIELTFAHKDRTIVTEVLNQVVTAYYRMHSQVHSPTTDFDQYLATQSDQLGSTLRATEEQLKSAKVKANITSPAETKKLLAEQKAKIDDQMLATKADLADRIATLSRLGQGAAAAVTNSAAPASTNEVAVVEPSPDAVTEYKRILSQLDVLTKREQELLVNYTPESALVKSAREQIDRADKSRRELEQQYPSLVAVKTAVQSASASANLARVPAVDPEMERARIMGLQSRLVVLSNQLIDIQKEVDRVTEAEVNISDLERKKAMQEADYKLVATSLQQSRINRELEPGRVSNISKIQVPSPPIRDAAKLQKVLAMLAFGGIALGLALAFLLDFYLDQSIKRPVDVETKLGIPLFLSIPEMSLNGNGHAGLLGFGSGKLLAENNGDAAAPAEGQSDAAETETVSTEIAAWDPRHLMRPFCEALRDRLITFFEARNMTHKPKLVAVTSCAEGSGVSTVAAGLAASLSETGEGNVLLVDMNAQNGAAHQFHKGDLALGIDEALESGKRQEAFVHENLYVVNESGRTASLPSILPRRFKSLVPKLKASDYDYIIFDMPPVSQVSLTPRLARFMDSVLMVVESEKTDRDLVKRAAALLGESKTSVGIVLNKGRQYVPRSLVQEL